MKPYDESPYEQKLADLGINLLTVSHIRIVRPYQCECGWRGRTSSQREQHHRSSKRHMEFVPAPTTSEGDEG